MSARVVLIFICRYNAFMSLTHDDLQLIRQIMREELEPLSGRLEALENDIKDMYAMIADLQRSSIADDTFRKRPAKERILILHAEIVAVAKELGVTLPQL